MDTPPPKRATPRYIDTEFPTPNFAESKRKPGPQTPMHKRLNRYSVDELYCQVQEAYHAQQEEGLANLQSHICARIDSTLQQNPDHAKLLSLREKVQVYLAEVRKKIALEEKKAYIASLPLIRQMVYRVHEYLYQTQNMTLEQVKEMNMKREEETSEEIKSNEESFNTWYSEIF